jgi:hypothetical protein
VGLSSSARATAIAWLEPPRLDVAPGSTRKEARKQLLHDAEIRLHNDVFLSAATPPPPSSSSQQQQQQQQQQPQPHWQLMRQDQFFPLPPLSPDDNGLGVAGGTAAVLQRRRLERVCAHVLRMLALSIQQALFDAVRAAVGVGGNGGGDGSKSSSGSGEDDATASGAVAATTIDAAKLRVVTKGIKSHREMLECVACIAGTRAAGLWCCCWCWRRCWCWCDSDGGLRGCCAGDGASNGDGDAV